MALAWRANDNSGGCDSGGRCWQGGASDVISGGGTREGQQQQVVWLWQRLEMTALGRGRRGVRAGDDSGGCGRGAGSWEQQATIGVEKQGRREEEGSCYGC
ncbi:hypothetical protein BHM03_00039699 [Ensete ventricosum]|nr:hypothetical protein BHM03_00039699 [Ensete ventricosum]